jgi:hypothetical protein
VTPQQLYDRFRADVLDTELPYLWSEDEVWGYLQDAERMLCRLAGGIRDASSEQATVAYLTAGVPWVQLHSSVLDVRSARSQALARTVPLFSFEELFMPQEDLNRGSSVSTDDLDQQGQFKALVKGMEHGKLRAVRIPDADDTLYLVVERLPLFDPRDNADSESGLEVGDMHRIHLLNWMKHLAFEKQDADTYDPQKSEKAQVKFIAYCEQVAAEKRRKNRTPGLVAYGGIESCGPGLSRFSQGRW